MKSKVSWERIIEVGTTVIAAGAPSFALGNLAIGVPTGLAIAATLVAVMLKKESPSARVRSAYITGGLVARAFSAIFEQMAYLKVLAGVNADLLPLGQGPVFWAWAFTAFMSFVGIWAMLTGTVVAAVAEEDRYQAEQAERYAAIEAERQARLAEGQRKEAEKVAAIEKLQAEISEAAERERAEVEREAARLEQIRAERPAEYAALVWRQKIDAAEADFFERKGRRPTQAELAADLGTSDRTIRKYRNMVGTAANTAHDGKATAEGAA